MQQRGFGKNGKKKGNLYLTLGRGSWNFWGRRALKIWYSQNKEGKRNGKATCDILNWFGQVDDETVSGRNNKEIKLIKSYKGQGKVNGHDCLRPETKDQY